jgi:hypothetical protein
MDGESKQSRMPVPERRVSQQNALAALSHIGPDLRMEDVMRHIFPEEAERIYDAGRWPFGPPVE